MHDLSGLTGRLVRLLSTDIRERCFLPTFYDLQSDYMTAVDRAPAFRRLLLSVAFRTRVIAALIECCVLTLVGAWRMRSRLSIQDVTFAVRMLVKSPGVTAAALAALALGIGANTAIFSVVYAVLLRPLPYDDPSRIVQIHETARSGIQAVAPPNFVDWKAQTRAFEYLAPFQDGTMTLGGSAPERLDAGFVGADVFGALGVPPMLGRSFTTDEERPNAPRVLMLGHGLWQRRFGGDPSIVGRMLPFDGFDYQVVGVMPRGFTFPGEIELWFPLVLGEQDTNDNQRGAHYIDVVGRLKPGVTLEQAQDDLTAIEQRIAARFDKVQGYGVWTRPLLDAMVGHVRRPLLLLLGAVGFVLLVACANVSSLLLARATGRRAEIALRSALGATRWRIVGQLLIESLMLSTVGGMLGVVAATWGVRVLGTMLPGDLPRTDIVAVNGLVLAFTVALSMVAGLVFGVAPAVYASVPDLSTFLNESGREGRMARSRRRFLDLLIAAEVALALVLLAGASLTIRSFVRLNNVAPGFDTSSVLSVSVALPNGRYQERSTVAQFYRTLTEQLAVQPGILSVGGVMRPPLSNSGFGGTFTIVGRDEGPDQRMQVRPVTPGYVETLRIPLRRGRLFTQADRENSANVAIITEEAARRFWPGDDPIGKRIRIHVSMGVREREREVVGVVGDVKLRTLEAAAPPVAYVPHAQYVSREMTLFVRTAGDPMMLVPIVKATLAGIDRDVALAEVKPATSLMSAAVAPARFRMLMMGLFAVVALVLAAVGLYGVMAYTVGQRRQELGVRVALGAESATLLRLVLREGLTPVTIGIAIGLAAAAALTRLMSTLIFEINLFDPFTFVVVPAFLALAAAIACYIPARRATRVDPLIALRHQ
jgi:putative ABC transport system permease protein